MPALKNSVKRLAEREGKGVQGFGFGLVYMTAGQG